MWLPGLNWELQHLWVGNDSLSPFSHGGIKEGEMMRFMDDPTCAESLKRKLFTGMEEMK